MNANVDILAEKNTVLEGIMEVLALEFFTCHGLNPCSHVSFLLWVMLGSLFCLQFQIHSVYWRESDTHKKTVTQLFCDTLTARVCCKPGRPLSSYMTAESWLVKLILVFVVFCLSKSQPRWIDKERWVCHFWCGWLCLLRVIALISYFPVKLIPMRGFLVFRIFHHRGMFLLTWKVCLFLFLFPWTSGPILSVWELKMLRSSHFVEKAHIFFCLCVPSW